MGVLLVWNKSSYRLWKRAMVNRIRLFVSSRVQLLFSLFSDLGMFGLSSILAQLGSAEDANRVGYFYENGLGVEKSLEKALRWYSIAARRGSDRALMNLGLVYENDDPGLAAEYFLKSADAGNNWARVQAAFLLLEGNLVPRDPARAEAFLIQASAEGYDAASYNLASMYYHGDGVAEDRAAAFSLCLRAAAHGYHEAVESVEKLYAEGLGSEKERNEVKRMGLSE